MAAKKTTQAKPKPADEKTTQAHDLKTEGQRVPKAEGEKYAKGYEGYAPSRDGDKAEDLTLQGVLKRQNGGS